MLNRKCHSLWSCSLYLSFDLRESKDLCVFLSVSQILSVSLQPPLICFCYFFKYQQSNQDIGDPAVTVPPCPDGIKSNTSLMPQTLYATAAFWCVDLCLHVCVCVWTAPHPCKYPWVTLQSARSHSHQAGSGWKQLGVETVKLFRTAPLIWDTNRVTWPDQLRFSFEGRREQNWSQIRFWEADQSWLTAHSFWVWQVAKTTTTTTLNSARLNRFSSQRYYCCTIFPEIYSKIWLPVTPPLRL